MGIVGIDGIWYESGLAFGGVVELVIVVGTVAVVAAVAVVLLVAAVLREVAWVGGAVAADEDDSMRGSRVAGIVACKFWVLIVGGDICFGW